ncbi:MAG: chromosomal replication initiator protein DnaA [Oligoflexia bacterium]|nr:chromosomal replication initiator protein DnaA [Oligoflexia bacterium]
MHEWPEIWQAAYRMLEQVVVSNQLEAWIQPLQLLGTESLEGKIKVRLGAPNDFSAQWVRDHHKTQIESAFSQVTGMPCELSLLVSGEIQGADERPTLQEAEPKGASSTSFLAPFTPTASMGVILSSGSRNVSGLHDFELDPRYTFETFVVGNSNQFAHASAFAVAEQPARQYNPLFLYSPPGLGKTHLLHAIGHHLIRNRPNARVAYLSAEGFVNEMIDSLQHGRMSQFRAKYRDSYDLILIDDIQFIAGKTKSEEEFFHTFNALYNSKRQIVLTSDRAPKEIQGLEERVRTRFEWGLVSDITPPEIETRIAILKAKAERDDMYLPDDVATFLATHIKSNVRELEGLLIKLQAQMSLTGAEVSLEMAKHELKIVVPEESATVTIDNIQAAVCKHFNLKTQELRSASRARNVAMPRQIGMHLVRKYTGLGFNEIGHYFGGKDHSTVMYACRKIESDLETDPIVRGAVEAIQNLL